MAEEPVNGPYDFLINPITNRPLSTKKRSLEELLALGRSIGMNQYGTGVEGEVDCVENNIVVFPGMIVEVTEGFEKIKIGEDGKEYTVPPYKYDALVLALQRNWDKISRTYTICATSTCSVLVLRLDSAQKCLFFDHKEWISNWIHCRDKSKERVTAAITSDVLTAEHVVTMLDCGIVGGHTLTLDFRVELGPHICRSDDTAGTSLLMLLTFSSNAPNAPSYLVKQKCRPQKTRCCGSQAQCRCSCWTRLYVLRRQLLLRP